MYHTSNWIGLACCFTLLPALQACCPVGRMGKPVVNADQTVIILWDAAQQKQHFIRKASFATKDQDFGFIIPSPSEPELNESGEEAFQSLLQWTSPEVIKRSAPQGGGCGCGLDSRKSAMPAEAVTVLQEKHVAGFQAVVLEAKNATALTQWLADHGYAYSPDVAAWAQPYIEQGWKFTALKVAVKEKEDPKKLVEATSLRLSFKTDRPLFPYREPASTAFAKELNQQKRLLRIYFLADKRYMGEFKKETPWLGQPAWAGVLSDDRRSQLLEQLKLAADGAPAKLYLTEFEDNWKYEQAQGDVYFVESPNQNNLARRPIIEYTAEFPTGDAATFALAGVLVVPIFWRRRKQKS